MSIQAVAWVLDHSQSRGYARLVLISLANHHNAGTGQCDPGQRLIALEAGISAGSVGPNIAKLVELGEVTISDPGTSHRSARYALTFAQQLSVTTRGKAPTTRGKAPTTRGKGESTRGLSRAEPSNHEPDSARLADPDSEAERMATALGVKVPPSRTYLGTDLEVEQHHADDLERERVKGSHIAGMRERLGMPPSPDLEAAQ